MSPCSRRLAGWTSSSSAHACSSSRTRPLPGLSRGRCARRGRRRPRGHEQRVDLDLGDLGVGRGDARERGRRLGGGAHVDRRTPSGAGQQAPRRGASAGVLELVGAGGRERDRDVVEELCVDAAEADEDERAEAWIAAAADDQLDAARRSGRASRPRSPSGASRSCMSRAAAATPRRRRARARRHPHPTCAAARAPSARRGSRAPRRRRAPRRPSRPAGRARKGCRPPRAARAPRSSRRRRPAARAPARSGTPCERHSLQADEPRERVDGRLDVAVDRNAALAQARERAGVARTSTAPASGRPLAAAAPAIAWATSVSSA